MLLTIWNDLFVYNPHNPTFFTNPIFWLYFGLILVVYQFLHSKAFARNLFIFLFSLFFYYKSSGLYLVILLFSIVLDYFVALKIASITDKQAKKIWLIASISANLGLLVYFKYTNFILENIFWLFESKFEKLDIFLPIGISFYTFQTISYVVDVYNNKIKPCTNFLDYAFYMAFFPHLVAGPIVRARDFLPQVYVDYQLSQRDFGHAIFLVINGLTKKILISDYIAYNFVDRVFEAPERYSGFENLMACYGYAIQIYCDFSGYTDIAIGVALLLGFRLCTNFDSPYKSVDITEFWRRWHISLSSWLRDYLYIPLGGNRKGKVRTYINLMLTMLLGGLWHGAHIKFIIWGGLHGLALAVHKFYMDWRGTKGTQSKGFERIVWLTLTFHFVCFCWIFFRATDMQIVQRMLYQIAFAFNGDKMFEIIAGYHEVFSLMLIAYLIHWLPKKLKNEVEDFFIAIPDFAKAVVVALVIIGLYQASTAAMQPFIYFQF
ncbi:MAG: MBOAT family protein [Microscillaceae bacterium]|nr:MBOAT family protein [Microscillaceae bacterium]MDW8459683.1 MBOAT family O-acyltransferase [Cytophagales bacterium]